MCKRIFIDPSNHRTCGKRSIKRPRRTRTATHSCRDPKTPCHFWSPVGVCRRLQRAAATVAAATAAAAGLQRVLLLLLLLLLLLCVGKVAVYN